MACVSSNVEFARRLLEEVLEHHNANLQQRGYTNGISAKFAGDAATLCGFDDLRAAFHRVLHPRRRSIWNLFRGVPHPAVKIVIPDKKMWAAFTTIQPYDELADRYPKVTDEYFEQNLETYADDDFDQAFNDAGDDYCRTCVLITQVCAGQTAEALRCTDKLSEPGRECDIKFVAAIEHFRAGQTTEAQRLLDLPPRIALDEFSMPELALGLVGRAAWEGYPYPDS